MYWICCIHLRAKKNEKYENEEWYVFGDNKDCVRVDKDGNGLQRLYQQTLTMFPLARIETADAIVSKYPTVRDLMLVSAFEVTLKQKVICTF